MSLKVKFPSYWQFFTDGIEMAEVNGSTVGECLEHLVEQFPPLKKRLFDRQGGVFPYFNLYVNGESAYPERLNKTVKDGDEIRILLVSGGG